MKKILLLFLVLFLVSFNINAWALSWSLVSNVCAGSSDTKKVTSGAVNMTGVTLEVMFVACNASVACGGAAISDSTGMNTWTLGKGNYDSGEGLLVYYVINPTVSSSQTFTVDFGSNASLPAICVMGFSGGQGIVRDASSGTASGSNVTTIVDGGITPSKTGELLVSGGDANTTTATVNSVNLSYIIPSNGTQAPSVNNWALGAGYLVSNSTSYQQATWTYSSSISGSASVLGFIIGTAPPTIISNANINNAIIN